MNRASPEFHPERHHLRLRPWTAVHTFQFYYPTEIAITTLWLILPVTVVTLGLASAVNHLAGINLGRIRPHCSPLCSLQLLRWCDPTHSRTLAALMKSAESSPAQ